MLEERMKAYKLLVTFTGAEESSQEYVFYAKTVQAAMENCNSWLKRKFPRERFVIEWPH